MTLPVVVIPAYEPSESVVDQVVELGRRGFADVLVVDDGSGKGYRAIFDGLAALPGVTVLRHERNRGKGAALRTAFTHVLQDEDAKVGIVTVDADGQHVPADVERVAAALVRGAGDGEERLAVLGERNFDLPDIPLRSRFGNKTTTKIIEALFGRRLRDTQTGLRGVSRALVSELVTVSGDRFDYEMRALVHLLASRARIESVEIETVYEGGQNPTSHFRPVRDSAIIYAAIFTEFAKFAAASLLGFAVDILVFVAVVDLVFDGVPTLASVGIATVVARVVSALTNFAVNHWLVFRTGARPGGTLTRYVVLATGVMATSWLCTTAVSSLLGDHVVWAKLLVDSVLFIVSYLAQRRWVFARRAEAVPSLGTVG